MFFRGFAIGFLYDFIAKTKGFENVFGKMVEFVHIERLLAANDFDRRCGSVIPNLYSPHDFMIYPVETVREILRILVEIQSVFTNFKRFSRIWQRCLSISTYSFN